MSKYSFDTLNQNLERVRSRIERACERSDRTPEQIRLVAVSKTHPLRALEAMYEAGVRHFGESYVQEWQQKRPELPDDINWHFVGHLQSNKSKYIADEVRLVHSVDRKSVMKELDKRSSQPVGVLLQVNVAKQDSKSGVFPEDLIDLLELSTHYENLRVEGLMTLPPYVDDPETNRPRFQTMHRLYDEAVEWLERHAPEKLEDFTELSMGMTNDFEVAIEEGATIVRIGTALFGERND